MLDYKEPELAGHSSTIQSRKVVGLDKFHYGTLSATTSDLPHGWSASISGAVYIVTHNMGHTNYKFFSTVLGNSGDTIQITSKTSTGFVLASLSTVGGVNPTPDVDFVLIEHAPN